MPIETLLTFVVASALLSMAPGPDNLFVMLQSALFGRKAGILVTLGLCSGLIVHTSLVAVGSAALFMTNPLAFTILKFAGASYLFYLAFNAFQAVSNKARASSQRQLSQGQLYTRGIMMNLSNPKLLIFFLAFLPQFASAETGNIAMQIMALGLIFILITLLVFGFITLIAGALANWLKGSRQAEQILQGISCLVYLGLALRLTLLAS